MGLNTRLEDENIFFSIDDLYKKRIKKLNTLGVFTVSDFLDLDIRATIKTDYIAKQYRVFQKLLRSKYLNEPLANDVLLYEKINLEERYEEGRFIGFKYSYYIMDYFRTLGFGKNSGIYGVLVENANKTCTVLDIINDFANVPYECQGKYISQLYVDYVSKINNSKNDSQISELERLKQEYYLLNQQRAELDLQISKLSMQIASLEGGSISHGRK